MRNLLIGLLVLLTACGCSILYNEHTVKVPDTTLTMDQAAQLNIIFDSIRGDFDFIDKKVAFLEGKTKMHISEFLDDPCNTKHRYSYVSKVLYILTDSEKVITNGYDAIVVRIHLFIYPRNKYVEKVANHPLSIKVINKK